jgi:hypothetical protein
MRELYAVAVLRKLPPYACEVITRRAATDRSKDFIFPVFMFRKINRRLSSVAFPAGRVQNCCNAVFHARSLEGKACLSARICFI